MSKMAGALYYVVAVLKIENVVMEQDSNSLEMVVINNCPLLNSPDRDRRLTPSFEWFEKGCIAHAKHEHPL